ncbi:MAG: hypothetical protein MN733_20140 [Nitrososphaera sp.]|nr:hypothetical protein [Nitrososphaera sp.]
MSAAANLDIVLGDEGVILQFALAGDGIIGIGFLNALFCRQDRYCWASELSITGVLGNKSSLALLATFYWGRSRREVLSAVTLAETF